MTLLRVSDNVYTDENYDLLNRSVCVQSGVRYGNIELFERNIFIKKLQIAKKAINKDQELKVVIGIALSVTEADYFYQDLSSLSESVRNVSNIIIEIQSIEHDFDKNTLRKVSNNIRALGYKLSLNIKDEGDSFMKALLAVPIDFLVIGRLLEQMHFDEERMKGIIKSVVVLTGHLNCQIIVYKIRNKSALNTLKECGINTIYIPYGERELIAK